MNSRKPDRFAFLEKEKTSGRDSLSICVQLWNATCKGLFWSLILSASMLFMPWSCWNSHCIYVCIHTVYCRKPESLRRSLTSVQGQTALPFNNTCCSSERLDEDDYTLLFPWPNSFMPNEMKQIYLNTSHKIS